MTNTRNKPIEITDDAANMIRQLQDEKRELRAESTKWFDRAREAATEVGDLQERNERLKSRVGDLQELVRELTETIKILGKPNAENSSPPRDCKP